MKILISIFFAMAFAAQIPAQANYAGKLESISGQRKKLAKEYAGSAKKKEVLEKARKSFISLIYKEIIPAWYGTDWDFYGTSETPKEGKIACGYFVTTILRDAGLKVNRISLAQQASENIIKSLVSAQNIRRFSNIPIEKFVSELKGMGEGIYIVGLDFHVGFIVNDGGESYFIHSSYIEPSEVIKEKAAESEILGASKYRVLGKISAEDILIRKWLSQAAIPTIRR